MDGDTQRARKCLDVGAYVVESDENGCCALFLAAERAHVDCMRLLLQHGAGVDQAANHGATPLIIACCNGHVDAARILLDKGADLKTYKGREDARCCGADGKGGVWLLVDKGAKIDAATARVPRHYTWRRRTATMKW